MASSVFLSQQQIQARIEELADQLNQAYRKKHPVVLGLLRGSVPFLSDLMRRFAFPFELEFVQGSSYGGKTSPQQEPVLQFFGTPDWNGRDVLVIDDIIDTGATLLALRTLLLEQGARSVMICTLLDKPSRRRVPLSPDWSGFEIPDLFVVGFGMDHAGMHRGLPWIEVMS